MKNLSFYLTFDGDCKQAMEFYQSILGGELEMMPFEGSPMADQVPQDALKRIMHATLRIGNQIIMASDGMPDQAINKGNNFQISVDCNSTAEQDELFSALENGGEVEMPVQSTFWGSRFGMLQDQFGVRWMLSFDEQAQEA